MCGRFACVLKDNSLKRLMTRHRIENYTEPIPFRFNVAPSQAVAAFIPTKRGNVVTWFSWGLLPAWVENASTFRPLINIRSEGILDKRTFRYDLIHRRCLIPATAFYEWSVTGKQPWVLSCKDREVFCFAGIYEQWVGADGSDVQSCGIITTSANSLIQDIHTRMPVILTPAAESIWLNGSEQNEHLLQSLLVPYPSDQMQKWQVSRLVNSPANDTESCLDPIQEQNFF